MKTTLRLFLLLFSASIIAQSIDKNDSTTIAIKTDKLDVNKVTKDTLSLITQDPEISAFQLSIGYDFDFIDGIRDNSIYTDFNVTIGKLFTEESKFSMDAGVIRARFQTVTDTSKNLSGSFAEAADSSVWRNRDYQVESSTTNEFTNIFLRFRYRLKGPKQIEDNYLKWFVHVQYDYFRRVLRTENSYKLLLDSISTLPIYTVGSALNPNASFIQNEFDEYNLILGTSIYKATPKMDIGLIWNFFGIQQQDNSFKVPWSIQATVIDKSILGAKLGFVLRDTYSVDFNDAPTTSKAEYYFFVSKVISLSSLFNGVKGLASLPSSQ